MIKDMGGGSNEVPFSKVPGEFGKLLHFVVDVSTVQARQDYSHQDHEHDDSNAYDCSLLPP